MPEGPYKFCKYLCIQVAHFEPVTIICSGEGVFPRLSLNLPRHCDCEGRFDWLLRTTIANLAPTWPVEYPRQEEKADFDMSKPKQSDIDKYVEDYYNCGMHRVWVILLFKSSLLT